MTDEEKAALLNDVRAAQALLDRIAAALEGSPLPRTGPHAVRKPLRFLGVTPG